MQGIAIYAPYKPSNVLQCICIPIATAIWLIQGEGDIFHPDMPLKKYFLPSCPSHVIHQIFTTFSTIHPNITTSHSPQHSNPPLHTPNTYSLSSQNSHPYTHLNPNSTEKHHIQLPTTPRSVSIQTNPTPSSCNNKFSNFILSYNSYLQHRGGILYT